MQGLPRSEKGVEGLLSKQQDDGGWAQTADMDSDAYATGLALVALHQAGDLPVSNRDHRMPQTSLFGIYHRFAIL